jgi:hypothetical protein
MVESSKTVVVKAELVDTCKRYLVAPVTALHASVSVVGWFVAPLMGDESVGVASVVVVKLYGDENSPHPEALPAATRQ